MTKKKRGIRLRLMTDGKPTSLAEIQLQTLDTSLQEALGGDYITALEAGRKANIKSSDLAKWRDSGKIRAKKIGGRWLYSRQDVINVIKGS